jgi:hypothetical protein
MKYMEIEGVGAKLVPRANSYLPYLIRANTEWLKCCVFQNTCVTYMFFSASSLEKDIGQVLC